MSGKRLFGAQTLLLTEYEIEEREAELGFSFGIMTDLRA